MFSVIFGGRSGGCERQCRAETNHRLQLESLWYAFLWNIPVVLQRLSSNLPTFCAFFSSLFNCKKKKVFSQKVKQEISIQSEIWKTFILHKHIKNILHSNVRIFYGYLLFSSPLDPEWSYTTCFTCGYFSTVKICPKCHLLRGVFVISWPKFRYPYCHHLAQGFSARSLLTFGAVQFVVGAILCIVECFAASLTTNQYLPVTPSPQVVTNKNSLLILPGVLWGDGNGLGQGLELSWVRGGPLLSENHRSSLTLYFFRNTTIFNYFAHLTINLYIFL